MLDESLSLVKVRGAAQITLPGVMRKALHVQKGDYLEATLMKGGLFLKPVMVIDRAAARKRLLKTLSGGSRYRGHGPEPSEESLNRMVVRHIKSLRRKHKK